MAPPKSYYPLQPASLRHPLSPAAAFSSSPVASPSQRTTFEYPPPTSDGRSYSSHASSHRSPASSNGPNMLGFSPVQPGQDNGSGNAAGNHSDHGSNSSSRATSQNYSYPGSASYEGGMTSRPEDEEDDGFFLGGGGGGGGAYDGHGPGEAVAFPKEAHGSPRPDRGGNPFAGEVGQGGREMRPPNASWASHPRQLSQSSSWYDNGAGTPGANPFAGGSPGGSFKSSLRNPVPSLRNSDSTASLAALAERERARGEFGGLGPSGLANGSDEAGMMDGGAPSITSSMSGFGGISKQLLMAEHIFRKGLSLGWFPDQAFGIVAVRSGLGSYVTFPPESDVEGVDELLVGIKGLNCEVAVVVTSNVVRGVVDGIPDDKESVPLKSNQQLIQVLDNLDELTFAKRHQHAAFIRNDRSLVVWSDNVQDLVPQVQAMHDAMIAFVWDSKSGPDADPYAYEEESHTETDKRKVMKLSPILVGLATGLNILICCLSIRTILIEYFTDKQVMRLIILVSIPFQFCVLQFFTSAICTVIGQILAPVKQIQENSRYFSGQAPPVRITGSLPHFTIQMPVYKEGLESVLKPTIQSVQRAMKTYELQGGSTSLFICDDGMQLLSPEELEIRKEYYDLNSIAYVARPPHSTEFFRAGRFKKASNLNYALELSIRLEEMLNERRPLVSSSQPIPGSDSSDMATSDWTNDQEEALYKECLADALVERTKMLQVKEYPEGRSTGEMPKGRKARKEEKEKRKREESMVVEKEKAVGPWAQGNIRMGEFVLLIDSDTRIPEDCFLDAASEMRLSPDVAILQHYSEVMFVARHFFENGIAFFTRMVNLSISWVCSNGDVAPFVGHNAFLRWSALQEVATDEEGGRKQIWSETHVSEDFDMALRLLRKGYVVRWCTYANGGFEEGVSLTADDEVNRWQKYAYGVSELIFNPFWKWPFKGPLTSQIISFLVRSSLPIHYKFSSFSYMMSYFAIGVAWPLSIFNYAMYGLFIPTLDLAYVPAWNITLGLLVVFSLASSVSFSALRFRSGDCGILRALGEQFMWLPFFLIFFGGLSFHVSMALLSHMFGINMTWSATVKDAVSSTVFKEIPAIWKRFWIMLTLFFFVLVGVILLTTPLVPMEWQVLDFISIFPLMMVLVPHLLYPIALNPYITRFRY